ncbi:MAG TPA: MBL fold metallo-hydrolase [Opitutaceae bacterium]|nr:MBL fold metallo-hydrolase [Opitutaceae bacterium]
MNSPEPAPHSRRVFLKLSTVGAATTLAAGADNLQGADPPRAPLLGPYGFTDEIVPGLHVCAMMPPKLGLIPTYLGVCAYLIQNPGSRPFLIDSGMSSQTETLVDLLARHGVKPADVEMVVCTHEHDDHTGGCAFFQQNGARIAIHEAAGESLAGAAPFRPDVRLRDGDTVRAGGVDLRVLHTPGHTPASCCLAQRLGDRSVLFAGDLAELYIAGVGDAKAMLASVKRARAVPADCVCFGHKIVDEDVPGFWDRFEQSVADGHFYLEDSHDYRTLIAHTGQKIIARGTKP